MTSNTIHSVNLTGYKVENKVDGHTLISDEPIELGGTDLGMDPTNIFLSSLASCVLITIRMYAQRKNWEIGESSISLSLIREDDSVTIEKKLSFSGELTEEQLKRLKSISDRCPVAKLVAGEIKFKNL